MLQRWSGGDDSEDDDGEGDGAAPRPLVRGRAGVCSFQYMIEKGVLRATEFPQYDGPRYGCEPRMSHSVCHLEFEIEAYFVGGLDINVELMSSCLRLDIQN